MNNLPILIIGKNGKTGSRVNQRLQALGYSTRAVSRSTTPAFDWENPATWESSIQGVQSAYVTYQPDLAVPSAESTIRKFIEVAANAGLKHIVLLSGRGEDGAQRAEQVLINSGISWNVVRCSWFSQNFSESFMVEGILNGDLVLPATDTVEPFLDADDIADAVVAVLTDESHRNILYELTGPEALSFAQCVEEISRSLGRPITYTGIPVDSFISALNEQSVPKDMQWLLNELFTVVFDGRNSNVMPDLENLLGRPAADFKTYVAKCLASGVWDSEIKQSA